MKGIPSRFLILLYLIALAIRLAFFLLADLPLPPDGQDYLKLGQHLADTGELGYDWNCRTYRGPVYPAFIASCQWIGMTSPRAIGFIQILLSSFIPVVCFHLFRRGFPEAVARTAALLCALWPDLILYSGMIMSESLSLLLFLLGLLLFIKAFEERKYNVLWGFLSGIVAIATILTRGLNITLLPALAVYGWLQWRQASLSRRKVLILLALYLLGAGVVEIPWMIRNYRLHGRIIPVYVGITWNAAYLGYQERALYNEQISAPYLFSPELDELEQERRLKADTLAWIKDHPGKSLLLVYNRTLRFWSPWRDILFTGVRLFNNAPMLDKMLLILLPTLCSAGLIAFAVPGFFLRDKRSPLDWMLLAHGAALFLMCSLLLWDIRFRFTLIPILALYAADAWHRRGHILEGWRIRDTGIRWRCSVAAAFLAYNAIGLACIFWFIERHS